ncbi:MAG: response regulator [Elusimicrobia bacterium]|nr:response regulator [Elusimicrobiota bacterium]
MIASSARILVADDEECVHRLLRRALPGEAYRVVSAATSQEALARALAEVPDLIVLDVHMPGQGGLEVLAELRRDCRTRLVPIILLTGDAAPEDRVRGLDGGADDYVSKPFHPSELAARIASALRRSRADVGANPLTRLPGSPTIEEEVNRRIDAREPFAFLYVDIDRFKAFNDVYGYAKGDAMIRDTAALLTEAVAAEAASAGFVGHVGGDDFVLLCRPSGAERLAQHAAGLFDEGLAAHYAAADLDRGFLECRDRQGSWHRSPLCALSIAGVTTERRRLDHYAKVVELASEMKAYVKSRPAGGSAFAFDRRRDR